MALICLERIVDLGSAGVLTLTLDSTAYLPLPAAEIGHARWHDPDGQSHDRLALCTRASGREALRLAVEQQRARLVRAAPSVRGRLDWTAARIAADREGHYRELPHTAAALGQGRVLLMFGGVVEPRLIRVVDIPAGTVLAEEGVDALCERLAVQRLMPGYPFDANVHGSGGPWAGMWLGRGFELLALRDGRLERAANGQLGVSDRFALTPNRWFVHGPPGLAVRVLDAERGGAELVQVLSPHARGEQVGLASADEADRCLLSHPGGTIEWLDGDGRNTAALRPFPDLSRKDMVGVGRLSARGRYALCHGREHLVVVDGERSRQAPVADLQMPADHDPYRFEPVVLYRPDQAVTEQAWLQLHHGELQVRPLDSLDWTETLPVQARKRRGTAVAPIDPSTWADLHKPARALRAGGPVGTSRLYGQADLPAADWPLHDGRAMQLLCQIDLAAAAILGPLAPLPDHGFLWCFVSLDAGGEVLIDELFNPVSLQVLWRPVRAATPPHAKTDAWPAQGLQFATDTAEWPQPDAAIVGSRRWKPAQLEAYRSFVDRLQPDGPAPGHRLGGYPTVVQHNDLEADAGAGAPDGWRLLLQLDSDDQVMWGTDTGRLYVLVHEGDLARRDFSRVVAITQGH